MTVLELCLIGVIIFIYYHWGNKQDEVRREGYNSGYKNGYNEGREMIDEDMFEQGKEAAWKFIKDNLDSEVPRKAD